MYLWKSNIMLPLIGCAKKRKPLRMDGILALDLWDVVIEVLHSSNNVPPTQKISTPECKPKGAAGPLLAKGSFTRDEWCNVLCLVKILNLSLFSRSHFRSVEQATTISKIIQERRTCGRKAEVSVFDFSKSEQRAILFIGSGCSQISGRTRSWIRGVSKEPAGNCRQSCVEGAAGNCRQNCVAGAAENCRQDIVQNRLQNTQNVFSSLERRQPLSTELRETATAQCPRRCA